jgi:hypothetical protein
MTAQIFIDDEDVAVLDGFPTNQENYDFLALEASSEVGAKITWPFSIMMTIKPKKNGYIWKR